MLHFRELVEESDDSRRSPPAVVGSFARRNGDGLLAGFVSENVGLGHVAGVLHGAAGRADQLVEDLSVVVSAHAAVLGAVGAGNDVDDLVTGVTEAR